MTAGPVPIPTPVTQQFWDAAAREELQIQRCAACDAHVFPPRTFCPVCAGPLDWVRCSGGATVASFAINHRPDPSFDSDAPQILALVDLDEGVRMATNLVGLEPRPEAIRIGMPVDVVFVSRGDVRLPMFAPREEL